MNRIINDIDNFKLIQSEYIGNEDYQILFMLYQPIIGIEAINLYLTLIQEKTLTKRINLDFNHGRLKTLLRISTTQLLIAFQQLEAVNLIKTYHYSLKSTYIYQLLLPLSANNFFANNTLNNKLLTQLGSLNYERQKFYFINNDIEITENYIDISEQENSQAPTLTLQSALNNIYATHQQLESNPIFSFHSKPQPTMKVNMTTSTPEIVVKNNSELFNNTLLLIKQKLPEEYLTILTANTPTQKVIATLHTLTNDYQLNNAIINCILEYVWFKNNKRLEPNYIIKIAQTFQENKITNIDDAMKHLTVAYSRSKNNIKQQFQQESLWTSVIKTTSKTSNNPAPLVTTNTSSTMTPEEINHILKEFDAH